MALDQFTMRKARRGQLAFDEQRKIEALEMIADALIEASGELSTINRNLAVLSRDKPSSFGR